MRKKDMGSRLDVYLGAQLVGRLWLDERRRFVFQYDAEWQAHQGAIPLSLSLPLQEKPYVDDAARPFFSNLLPEAEIRNMIARRLGISEKNDFALLKEIGGECAGAVSLLPEGSFRYVKPGYREINEEELHKVVTELPRKPLLAGEKGIRLSLAGAQNKLPVYMEGDRIFLSTGNAPSTHIIKPPIAGLKGTVENEAFCMMLAARIGLSVPNVTLRLGMDRLYIVERYDRERDHEDKVRRLHQEDFCQALGILPEQKYEAEGGPSLARCFSLLREKSTRPAADRKALLIWVVFNLLIGNADAHAKNLAIFYSKGGSGLAPFYDLMCTRVYPDLTDRLAMRIGSESRPNWIQPRHWERLSEEVGIKARLIHRIVGEISQDIIPIADSVARDFMDTYGYTAIVEKIVHFIGKMAERVRG